MKYRSKTSALLIFFIVLLFCSFSPLLAQGGSKEDKKTILEGLDEEEKKKLSSKSGDSQEAQWRTKHPLEGIPSEIESILSGRFPTGISKELHQFGYNFFTKGASLLKPVVNVPVGSDYMIGPGDNFTIHLWGRAEQTYKVTITRDGSITLPRLGTLNVGSLTFAELKIFLKRKFKEYYPDFEMSITMGALRTVEIFIVGEVNKPGTYSISSLSTVISALYAAGGPTKKGSLRDIRVVRNGKPVKKLDLYDFFIMGIKKDDIRLQPGDTIFIPVIGPVAGIAGYVKRPAIYEMNGAQTISDLIEISGGVLPVGYLQNVVIERVKGHQRRIIKSFNLDPSHEMTNENLETSLKDGDLIKIYPVHKGLRKVVYLEGHIKYPRNHELKPGMKLRDLIISYDYLLPEPYLELAEIIRLIPPDLHPEIIEFNLGALLSGDENQNLLLQDQDRVIIYDRWEKKEKPEITINGAVRNPGKYFLVEGMTIKDLIFQAGNLTDKAYLNEATLTRIMIVEEVTETLRLGVSLKNILSDIAEENLVLQKDDVIYIREIPQYRKALERKVSLKGEFLFPGEYTFSEGERISSIIERAGGFTNNAYLFGAIFLRKSVKEIQRERLNEYISKLERNILTAGAISTEKALDKDESLVLEQTLNTQRALLAKLKISQPTGRMVINLEEVSVLASSKYNFRVRPGDSLIVKERPDFVVVMGEVYNPTALFMEKGRDVEHYLSLVGGVTKNADKKDVYIIKANGAVMSRSQGGFFGLAAWDQDNRRWSTGSFNSIKLNSGDTIIVPLKIITYPWMRFFQDTTEILYKLAVTAGVLDSAIGIF